MVSANNILDSREMETRPKWILSGPAVLVGLILQSPALTSSVVKPLHTTGSTTSLLSLLLGFFPLMLLKHEIAHILLKFYEAIGFLLLTDNIFTIVGYDLSGWHASICSMAMQD